MPVTDNAVCPLCLLEIKLWNKNRRQLHINACCEKAISECVRCPACHKSFTGSASRSHLKQCASTLNMTLVNLLTLSEHRQSPQFHATEIKYYMPTVPTAVTGNVEDDLQTALALSLSLTEEDKRRRSEAEMGSKIPPTELGPPSHLLLTEEQRQSIFSDRLAALLLQAQRPAENRSVNASHNSLPPLWALASGDVVAQGTSKFVSDSLTNAPYYVKALVPPLSPATTTWGANLLSLSQLPGRSTSHSPAHSSSPPNHPLSSELDFTQTQGFIPDEPTESCHLPPDHSLDCPNLTLPVELEKAQASPKRDTLPADQIYNSRYLGMIGQSSCSDACFILDTGQQIPVHKFVFSAWGIESSVFPNGSSSSVMSDFTYSEVFRLLALLYQGNEDVLYQEWDYQSQTVQDKLRSWGVHPPTDAKTSSCDLGDLRFSSTICNAARSSASPTTPKQLSPATMPSTALLNEVASDKLPVALSSELITPSITLSSRSPLAPQFSRDLFSSPWESMCGVPQEVDLNDSPPKEPQLQASPLLLSPGHQSHSASMQTSPTTPPLFDAQPTPCPLLKRLRASETPQAPISELSRQQSFTPLSPSIPTTAIVPTPSNEIQDVGLVQSPPGVPTDTLSDVNFESWNTPLSTRGGSVLPNSPVTPLPDYKAMMTPELKCALSAFGVRPLPRKRAVTLLNEIYQQLHQYTKERCSKPTDSLSARPTSIEVSSSSPIHRARPRKRANSTTTQSTTPGSRKKVSHPTSCKLSNSTLPTTASGSFPTSTTSSNPSVEWSDEEAPPDTASNFEVNDVDDSQGTETAGQMDIKSSVISYLRSQQELYTNILTYTPIEFSSLHCMLKESGLRISAKTLMDILDEQCITFTLRNRARIKPGPRSTRVIKAKCR